MKRDRGVTVTVTSRVTGTCDVTRTTRVSHATTTTPHHTYNPVAEALLHPTVSRPPTPATLPRRPAPTTGPMQDKP
jgi:hypothetical protein